MTKNKMYVRYYDPSLYGTLTMQSNMFFNKMMKALNMHSEFMNDESMFNDDKTPL